MEIFSICAQQLRNEGRETWDEEYPTEGLLLADLAEEQVLIASLDDTIVGTITITHDIDIQELGHISWGRETANYIALARLGVDPAFQGRGIGKALFDHADLLAERQGYESIRLDVLRLSQALVDMYQRRGYSIVGEVDYADKSFYVMERVVPERRFYIVDDQSSDEERERLIAVSHAIREIVFRQGQNVPEAIDIDGLDETLEHIILFYGDEPAGCIRLHGMDASTMKFERFAVRDEFRGRGLGNLIFTHAMEYSLSKGYTVLTMHAQYYLFSYYTSLGFVPVGEVFSEAGIDHIEMKYTR